MNKLNPYYVTGFAEGEGSFYVGISPRLKNRIGWEVRASFSLSQHERDSNLVYLVQDFFRCGAVRFNKSDNTLKYEVRGIKDLVDKIIPHFRRYPLRGKKKKDFAIFVRVINLILEGKHLERAGLRKIVGLSQKMRIRNKWRIKSLKRIYTLLKE